MFRRDNLPVVTLSTTTSTTRKEERVTTNYNTSFERSVVIYILFNYLIYIINSVSFIMVTPPTDDSKKSNHSIKGRVIIISPKKFIVPTPTEASYLRNFHLWAEEFKCINVNAISKKINKYLFINKSMIYKYINYLVNLSTFNP